MAAKRITTDYPDPIERSEQKHLGRSKRLNKNAQKKEEEEEEKSSKMCSNCDLNRRG